MTLAPPKPDDRRGIIARLRRAIALLEAEGSRPRKRKEAMAILRSVAGLLEEGPR